MKKTQQKGHVSGIVIYYFYEFLLCIMHILVLVFLSFQKIIAIEIFMLQLDLLKTMEYQSEQ